MPPKPILAKSMNTRSSTHPKLSTPSKTSDTTQQSPSNTSSDTTITSGVSTPPKSTSIATRKNQPNPPSSPDWPLFNKDDKELPKGLPFFRARNSNILNFQQKLNTTWRHVFCGSEMRSWKDREDHKGAVNLVLVGRLGKATLTNAISEYNNDPVYRLDLILERDTAVALRTILDNGPLRDMDNINYPILSRTVRFSAKLKTLQNSDALYLDVDDPFPFLFDGRDMAQGNRTLLKDYSAVQLSDNDVIAVETNISSYDIPAKGESSGCMGYSLSLCCIYFLAKNSMDLDESSQLSPKNLKHQGDSLVSLRRNKKAGQLAVFSDED